MSRCLKGFGYTTEELYIELNDAYLDLVEGNISKENYLYIVAYIKEIDALKTAWQCFNTMHLTLMGDWSMPYLFAENLGVTGNYEVTDSSNSLGRT